MTSQYYKLPPEQILTDICQFQDIHKITIKGKEFLIHPNVYPSEKFRTTNFLLDVIQPIVPGATVCDMGCGMGIVGLYALMQGAEKVVQADVNPLAIKNAIANQVLLKYNNEKLRIYESNCFDKVPLQTFDIIIFNIPFHCEPFEIEDPLEYAFHDPNFFSTQKFLAQAVKYSHATTQILIAFSNKGDVIYLENIFDKSDFQWDLWKVINQDQEFDNRIYKLQKQAD